MHKQDQIQVMYAIMGDGILTFMSAGGPIDEFEWDEIPGGYRCALCGNDVLFTRDGEDHVQVTHLKDKRSLHASFM